MLKKLIPAFFTKKDAFKLEEFTGSCGRKLPYDFKKSKLPDRPLLIILHGNGANREPAKFRSDQYNILCPLDRFGWQKNGCWFLGEHGDFFYLRLLAELVQLLASRHKLKPEIYIWGSSMGGTGALLHGFGLKARAVFCHIPQINLYNSHWYQKNYNHINHIFQANDMTHPYRNLATYVAEYQGYFPLIFLSFNRFDRPFYNDEHLQPLRMALEARNKNYFLLVHPQEGHKLHQNIATQISFFDLYQNEIQANYQAQQI